MNDKAYKKILLNAAGVVVGLSFFTIIICFAILILGAVRVEDFNTSQNIAKIYLKWTSVALACFIVPVVTSCVVSGLSKNNIFKIISAALCFILAVLSVVFIALVRSMAPTAAAYEAVDEYFVQLAVLASASAVLTFFFTVSAVTAYKKLSVKEFDVGGGEE